MMVSHNNVAQHPKKIGIKESLAHRRVSLRLQNMPKVNYAQYKKRVTSDDDGNHFVQQKIKSKPFMQQEASIQVRENISHLGANGEVTCATNGNEVHFVHGQISKAPFDHPRLVDKDLSNGQEAKAILVTNEYDDPPFAPDDFTYIKSLQFANSVKIPSNEYRCQCKGSCRNTKTCPCAKLNGFKKFPYQNGNRLIKARGIVFECGPNCGCGPDCENRVSQKGIEYQLEVYRTQNKGWAVRTLDFIPSGAPVCEYVGVIKRNDELNNATNNDYIFEIDCWETIKGLDGRERRSLNISLPHNIFVEKENGEEMKKEPEFCIDAGSYGNVARFINHSCEPNLFVQCVLSSHYEFGLARVLLFAGEDIHPFQELTYDYGYELDSVIGPDGNIKKLPCYCGTSDCRKRLY